jgi:hypothetical protein
VPHTLSLIIQDLEVGITAVILDMFLYSVTPSENFVAPV